ncbi:MAG TPA: regulatory iron-sulfur-containing complex subunit RicT [Candidatus Sumerlaeota bacterium]|nr:MAG: hypothetical protein BWY12_01106 [candidate division BRC1 bacterium ADurb.Bin183]HOE63972.1 regulatory iron-sulfur-containing complex subunit RicT [Candidatus Sumerlaeota bacterium]HRR30631.1 regulatory iron-sulfur-containing complex subunit RicT [Candidatus Sumerlaeia bacterium]HON50798.1 regulatory iron-sulfur-containing complex subunit RicT [Candidatus Sumerlaeota bacterium]HOR65492.1 regulatory iron-sulfur-containing complex subunit RicT [Candidatus Sumerlaeota bacterium]
MVKLVGIKFSDISMPKYYVDEGLELKIGDFCVCLWGEFETTGYVCAIEHRYTEEIPMRPLFKVIRKATEEEVEKWKALKERERSAIQCCREKALKYNLVMKISNVRFDDANNKIIFHFTADKRVDFRELVRDLAASLRARIELWQIGVRDEAREIDGYGVCGQRLCCAGFLREFKPVTIRMAKNQDIFLSPAKLSGCCGRLMCCLEYEEEEYKKLGANAPEVGAYVKTQNQEGYILERNLLMQTCVLQDANENKYNIKFDQIVEMKPPEHAQDEDDEELDEENNGADGV